MNFQEQQNKITTKATKKQVKAIIKQAKKQTQNVCGQMTKIIENSFTDTVYSKAIRNVDILSMNTDIECLKDTLEDYELNQRSAVLVCATITFNDNIKADVQAWVNIEDDMKIIKGDFRIMSEDGQIDNDALRPNSASFISDCLDTLQQVEDNELE